MERGCRAWFIYFWNGWNTQFYLWRQEEIKSKRDHWILSITVELSHIILITEYLKASFELSSHRFLIAKISWVFLKPLWYIWLSPDFLISAIWLYPLPITKWFHSMLSQVWDRSVLTLPIGRDDGFYTDVW